MLKGTIAIQADSLEQADKNHVTTLFLAAELEKRGYRVLWYDYRELRLVQGMVQAKGVMISVATRSADMEKPAPTIISSEPFVINLAEVTAVLIRQNPPVNMSYISTLHLLDLISDKVAICNSPATLLRYPEKTLPILLAPNHVPDTCIVRDLSVLVEFFRYHRDIVLKPMYDYGGNGVQRFTLGQDDAETSASVSRVSLAYTEMERIALMEASLISVGAPLIVHKFIPQIVDGDIRTFVAGGDIIVSLKRVPPPSSFLTAFSQGASLQAVELSSNERKIVQNIAQKLHKLGIVFACVDMVNELIIEVNITSPGILQECDKLYSIDTTSLVVDRMIASFK